jgi:chromosome segregation ATPase
MAKKPQREGTEVMAKNLVDTEVSSIQAVARDMAVHAKQLEEHSQRIKKYTDEIEKLAEGAASEKYRASTLEELIKNLEKTVSRLRQKQGETEAPVEPVKTKTNVVIPEQREKPKEEAVIRPPVKEVPEEKEEEIEAPKSQFPDYFTPEGFRVRKIR